jgi:hypothetical protein
MEVVMSLGVSPIVRRRRLGAELSTLRQECRLTPVELGARLGWPATKVSRLESARVRPDVGDVMDLLDTLGIIGLQRERLVDLARDAATTGGWWDAYDVAEERQMAYAELESGAIEIWEFQLMLIPGLLQCRDYAEARFASRPAIGLSPVDVPAAVQARLSRQALLTREVPISYEAILDEALLLRRCGRPGVRIAQLTHLVELSRLPSVTLRVLPYDAAVTRDYIPSCSFSYFRLADPVDPELITLETHTSSLVLGDSEDVTQYKRLYEQLREASFSPEDTMMLLMTIRDDPEGMP